MPTFRDDIKIGSKVPMTKTDDINDQAITTVKIRDGNVTTEKLAEGAVSTDKLPDGAIKTPKIADGNVTTGKLAEASVVTSKIADQNVTTEKLADQSVDNSKLSPSSVTYDKLKDKSVITEKLNDRAVTTEKVEEKAITNPKLGDQSVDSRVLREANVETKHLANESVTTDKVASKSITKDKIADNAVGTDQVANGSVTNSKLSSDSVDTTNIKDGSVTNDKVADNTLTKEKFDPELRKTIEAATGLPDDLTQMIQDVDINIKDLKAKDEDLQNQVDDKQQQITSNDTDIALLQTRSDQMEQSIKDISVSGGASQASAVTYDNTQSKLDSVNAQGAIDELQTKKFDVSKVSQETGDSKEMVMSQKAVSDKLSDLADNTEIKDEEGSVTKTPFRYIQNKEWIFAGIDAENRLLFGIHWDGTPEFSRASKIEDTLIKQVKELANRVSEIIGDSDLNNTIDSYKEMKSFFANVDNTERLADIISNLDKSLIKNESGEIQQTPFKVIENKEFIFAMIDKDDKIIFGIRRDTLKPFYPQNDMYHIISNNEYYAAWVDAAKHIILGLRRDGKVIGDIENVKALEKSISKLDNKLQILLSVFSIRENKEFLSAEVDKEDRIISTTNSDGSKSFNTPLKINDSIVYSGVTFRSGKIEDFKELLIDKAGNILRSVDKEDVVHENRHCKFRSVEFESIEGDSISDNSSVSIPRTMNLPKYGYTDIKEETFYLTANDGYSDKDGVLAMLVNADTQENAQKGLTPYKYYVKSTLQNTDGVYSIKSDSVALNFYVPSDIKVVSGKSYVTSSLTKGGDGTYSVNSNSIEVTKIVDKPNVGAWAISKNVKHWCVVDIDFGNYLKGTYNVLVSFQGSSTLYNIEKNFRYAFVKSDYKTKVKLKIGELLKVDKFNLKSYYSDDTKLKEPIIFRLYQQAKELRSFNEQYPWSNSAIIATGATGIIKSFPVCTSVGGDFYGIQFFGYKKDKANYMLSDDVDGMIISGGVGCNWAKFDWSTWEDEMNDEPTESNKAAVEKFYQFVNGSDFTKENAPKHLNINDWIDYFIFIQVFRLRDNDIHNLILYSGKDKMIFSPFLYDLDLSFNVYNYNLEADKTNTVWIKLKELYWDEICDRYKELRSSVLTLNNFNYIVSDLQSNMDYSDFEKGVKKWGLRSAQLTTGKLADTFSELLTTFDLYFKN